MADTSILATRPSASRKDEDKGNQILEAAGSLFLSEGFSAVSMAQIASEAGVSKQTVYSHYGSKEALLSAAINKKCADYEVAIQEADFERPVREFLRDFILHFNALVTSEAGIGMHRLCIADSKAAGLFWEAGPAPIHDLLVNYLDKQVERGRLAIDNTDFAAVQLLQLSKSSVHMRGVLGLPVEEERLALPAYLDSCLAMFIRAYGVPSDG
jgi:TetR/AcrR family transcriptional regulator, mexJK operon transcriptional repressor